MDLHYLLQVKASVCCPPRNEMSQTIRLVFFARRLLRVMAESLTRAAGQPLPFHIQTLPAQKLRPRWSFPHQLKPSRYFKSVVWAHDQTQDCGTRQISKCFLPRGKGISQHYMYKTEPREGSRGKITSAFQPLPLCDTVI